jgi:hypothetical protein
MRFLSHFFDKILLLFGRNARKKHCRLDTKKVHHPGEGVGRISCYFTTVGYRLVSILSGNFHMAPVAGSTISMPKNPPKIIFPRYPRFDTYKTPLKPRI